MIKTVCICGGGNLGLVCAGVIASHGYNVRILTGHPDRWNSTIKVRDDKGYVYSGNIEAISSYPQEVVPGADMVLLCLPGYMIEESIIGLSSFLQKDTFVGSIVSSTGFFFFAHKLLPDQPLFGFQRVPFISRTEEYGHTGLLLGYKKSINVALENITDPDKFLRLLEHMFITPVKPLESFYEAALTNSNPILHTARLYTLWAQGYTPLQDPVLFYADWTDSASQLMIEMDKEFMSILKALNVSTEAVPSLLEYYESFDAHSLTEKIRSIPAFRDIEAPMKHTSDGWIPDFSSRYFTEDFPYGLRFIKDLADELNIAVPHISQVLGWGISKCEMGS